MAINNCSMKYYNFLFGKCFYILNNNVQILITTYNNSIRTIIYKNKKITNRPSVNSNSYDIYKLLCKCNKFYIIKTCRRFKIHYIWLPGMFCILSIVITIYTVYVEVTKSPESETITITWGKVRRRVIEEVHKR